MCLYAPLCHEVPLHPLKYYLDKGLVIRRIYAVDYSSKRNLKAPEKNAFTKKEAFHLMIMIAGSNWNVQLHLRPLHDSAAGRSSFEEAIIMAAGAMLEIAQGDSIFYSFGNINTTPCVTSFGPENHIHTLIRNYRCEINFLSLFDL